MEMEKREVDPLHNLKSMDYYPTEQEAGIPQKLLDAMWADMDDHAKTEKHQKTYDGYITRFQLKHREKLKRSLKSAQEKKERKLLTHWFNSLQPKEIEKLVDKTRAIADQVLDEMRDTVKSNWELQYIEKLRIRVKKAPMSVAPASNDKLRRFPQYSLSSDTLHGSGYSFYRMWAHLFKSERAGKVSRYNI